MRTTTLERVTLDVDKELLMDGRFLPFPVLSKLVREYEESHSIPGKKLQTRLYNSLYAGRYYDRMVHGVKCVDVFPHPQEEHGKASLEITYRIIGG